ncbi:uncharacterized protein LOC117653730 [Thrips palmi]|uniref:Uncharacterized protein LOC117653730 n=1 Tax=Thrips palmi TaxID=161013 RepID=A0A6P9AJ49_THRPL|nr:uncharacterized protein LOC117653730 [Thrips palmi]
MRVAQLDDLQPGEELSLEVSEDGVASLASVQPSPDKNMSTHASQQPGPDRSVSNAASSQSSNAASSQSSSRKRSVDGTPIHIRDMDLDRILENGGLQGKLVLTHYAKNNDLRETHRNHLADCILGEYLKSDIDRKLPDHDIAELTKLILKRFPTEVKADWDPSKESANREKAVGRGFLLKRYYHMRREMHKGNLLKSPSTSKEKVVVVNGQENVDPVLFEKLLWLSNNRQPWSKVLELWKETHTGRYNKFYRTKQSIHEYFEEYPALKDKSGFYLIESDYDSKFPETSMNFFLEWPAFAAFVESKVNTEGKELIDSALTSEGKKIQTIRAMSYLFPVNTIARKGKKVFRPSRAEVGDTLILIVPSLGDIESTIKVLLRDKYEPFGMNLTPRVILVGQDEDTVTKSFIRINKILYEVENPLKAFD